MFRNTFVTLCFLALALKGQSQNKQEQVAIFLTGREPARPVVQSLTKALNDSTPFEVVSTRDSAKVSVLISCQERQQKIQPFGCMYVAHYVGASFSTMLGAGQYVGPTADDVALNFVKSISADIVERYADTNITNLQQSLEACLLLSESECDVPEPLQKSLGSKKITFREYVMKKHR
jgi:hypothetical protein